MKPGSLRIVGKYPDADNRIVEKYEAGQEEAFYNGVEHYEQRGYTLWLYEMTDRGWTEF